MLGVQVALNWIFEHMEDADFNDPPAGPAKDEAAAAAAVVSEESLGMLMSFGYSLEHATRALVETDSNVER